MQKNNRLPLLGYASGVGAGDTGCADGPLLLERSDLLNTLADAGLSAYWETMLQPAVFTTKLAAVADICQRLATYTQHLTAQQKRFAVLAGDHTCAVGTWSGVVSTIKAPASIGLIWIDAHMDSHTFTTTESSNIHGMPLAALLGHGATELAQLVTAQAKLRPEHVSLIGVRSYENGEAALLRELGVRIYFMAEVQERGMEVVLQEAIARAKQGTVGFGMSLDLDGIDPIDAPGVGSPEPNGIKAIELCSALKQLRAEANFLGVEIAEFNPHHDVEKKTERLVRELLVSIF